MMRDNISFVTLGVDDLERSTNFYKTMGLAPHTRSNPHITFFDMHGQILALFARTALANDVGLPDERSGFGGMTLAHNVQSQQDVQAMLDLAGASGGTVLRDASEPPWGGIRGYFADPDGHPWEVAWNPGVTIDDAGRVHLSS